MSQAITILGATQAQFAERVQQALTEANGGQPVKKQALIRKAVATILNQPNQHLPAAKFAENNATIEERIVQLLDGFDSLSSWSDSESLIERDFERYALDTDAKEKDITIDYRIAFDLAEKQAYFTIGKNFGDGVDGSVEIPLAQVPDIFQFAQNPKVVPDSVNGVGELLLGYPEMLSIYLAVASDSLLREIFLPEEQRFFPPLSHEKEPLPKLNAKVVGEALALMAKQRSEKGNDVCTADLAAGAATALNLFGEKYSHAANMLAFVHMTGDLDKQIDKKVYVVLQGYGEDDFFHSRVLRSYKQSEKEQSTPTDIEDNFDEDGEQTIRHYNEQTMKERFAWNTYANKPVYEDGEGKLIAL